MLLTFTSGIAMEEICLLSNYSNWKRAKTLSSMLRHQYNLVVSRNSSSMRIALGCFYLLIFYFEKFST